MNQADLERLVTEQSREGTHLDFKRDLPRTWSDQEKHRLLVDVVALANANGGDIIFGIEENSDAQATAIVPHTSQGIDEEVRRIQDLIQSLIEPRTPLVQVLPVEVSVNGVDGYVVVLRVAESWAKPHRLKTRTNQHFYVRDGLRNRQLDIPEIRTLLLQADGATRRAWDFRSERLSRLLSSAAQLPLHPGPRLVVHAIPTQAILAPVQIDPRVYRSLERTLPMLGDGGATRLTLNLEGVYGFLPTNHGLPIGYTQLFRQGFFEAVWVLVPRTKIPAPVLPGQAYEHRIIDFIQQVRNELTAIGVSTQLAVLISILDADWCVLLYNEDGETLTSKFDRRDLLLPDVLVPADVSIGRGLRPSFDLIWQSTGLDGSPNYGPDGEWSRS